MKPEEKALKYLISRRWCYDDEKGAARDLKRAFTHKKYSNKNVLGGAIAYLVNSRNWYIYCLNDIKNVDQARRIFQKYEKSKTN